MLSVSVQHGRRSETDVTESQYSRPDCWESWLSSTAEGLSWMCWDSHNSYPDCWDVKVFRRSLLNKHAVDYNHEICVFLC